MQNAPLFTQGQTILFQGDSITDCQRERDSHAETGAALGHGYAFIAASLVEAQYPELRLKFINRGISGNRVRDLRARWQPDCIDLKPDWVSILIGINDTWRRYDSGDPTSAEDFERDYRFILEQTAAATSARLILCEPFLLPCPGDRLNWREDLDPKIAVARSLAREFNALYVPFDGVFAAAATRREPAFWAGDGVHPSHAGHALMADAWLRTVRAR